jgi:hypothetical protein
MTKSTAVLRIEASEAECALNWVNAADLYELALSAYPKALKGDLYELDRKNLAKRAKHCRINAQRAKR